MDALLAQFAPVIGPFIAALLTVMVFSYIFGDNVLFQLATHIFVGVAVGYAIIVIWYQVFIPTFNSGNFLSVAPAFFLCFLFGGGIRFGFGGFLPGGLIIRRVPRPRPVVHQGYAAVP